MNQPAEKITSFHPLIRKRCFLAPLLPHALSGNLLFCGFVITRCQINTLQYNFDVGHYDYDLQHMRYIGFFVGSNSFERGVGK